MNYIKSLCLLIVILSVSLFPLNASAALPKSYDIIVVGAGSGGISAAIQASRMGMKVALLEPTDWVGGQMTAAGVSTMDTGSFNTDSGIYAEFIANVKAHYDAMGKSMGTCYWSATSTCFEPSVGQQVLLSMIQQANQNALAHGGSLDLYLKTTVISVTKNQNPMSVVNTVTGVVTSDGTIWTAHEVIDATEYGDIIPMTGANYRIGNTQAAFGLYPQDACVQDITYPIIIKEYPNGVPSSLVMNQSPPGYTNAVESSFLSYVGNGGHSDGTYPFSWSYFVGYRGLPDSSNPQNYTALNPNSITKTAVNLPNDFPYSVSSFNNVNRMSTNCQAKLKTLQFLYYMQHNLGLYNWSIANDEGYNTPYNLANSCPNIPSRFKTIEGYFPPIPYIRESRRVVGINTLTGPQIYRTGGSSPSPVNNFTWTPNRAVNNFSTSLAVGDYPDDMHGCNLPQNFEIGLEDQSAIPNGFVSGAFQVPYEAFIPQMTDGFLPAEKNLSYFRIASAASREQPATMMTGQASGTIAALAVKRNTQPRYLPPTAIQKVLLDAGNRLSDYDFWDVPRTNPYWEAVQTVSTNKLMVGYQNGSFGVKDPILRGDAAVVLVKLLNLPLMTPLNFTFTDVLPSDPRYEYIEVLYGAHIIAGCSVNPMMFCPNAPLTNAQLAVMATRVEQLRTSSDPLALQNLASTAPNVIAAFSDVPPTHYAYPFVQLAAAKRILTSSPDCPQTANLPPNTLPDFCPDVPATRGYFASYVGNSVFGFDQPQEDNTCRKTLTFSPSTSGAFPNTVGKGQSYYMDCDYGSYADAIWPDQAAGNCVWAGSIPGENAWKGTAAVFKCTAPSVSGAYVLRCGIHTGTPGNTCAQSNYVGTLTVQ